MIATINLEEIAAHSPRLSREAGFVCEGRLRASIFKDNQRLDSFLYARVRETA